MHHAKPRRHDDTLTSDRSLRNASDRLGISLVAWLGCLALIALWTVHRELDQALQSIEPLLEAQPLEPERHELVTDDALLLSRATYAEFVNLHGKQLNRTVQHDQKTFKLPLQDETPTEQPAIGLDDPSLPTGGGAAEFRPETGIGPASKEDDSLENTVPVEEVQSTALTDFEVNKSQWSHSPPSSMTNWNERTDATKKSTAAVSTNSKRRHTWTLLPKGTKVNGTTVASRRELSRVIVSEKLKVVFCPIPKAASSNWKYLLRKWEGHIDFRDLRIANNRHLSGLKYLDQYTPTQIEAIANDPKYFKFLFVRDPYSRSVSCYLNKFLEKYNVHEYSFFMRDLLGLRYVKTHNLDVEPRINYSSFVDGVVNQPVQRMNEHWAPQTHLCGFDCLQWDFIGHMETLEEDVARVLRQLGREDEVFPSQKDIRFDAHNADLRLDEFSTWTTRQKLYRKFTDDFTRLGYSAIRVV